MDQLESSPDRSGTINILPWGLNDSPDYVCGKPQTAQDIIYQCTLLVLLKEVDLAYHKNYLLGIRAIRKI